MLLPALWAQQQAAADQDSRTQDSRAQDSGRPTATQSGDAKPKVPIHIVPFGPPKTLKARPGQSNGGQVQYWGGPVISNVHVVEVLWGNFVDAPSTTGLNQFFTDITSSNYFGLLAEYSTAGLNGFGTSTPGSNQTIGFGFFDSKITITPSVCPGSSTNPSCSLNDTQIQTELTNQVNAGHLPQPVQDAQGNFNTIYMVYFPPGVHIIIQGTPSCAVGGFCAYHSNIVSGLKAGFPYGVFPDFGPTSGCSVGCGQGTSFQNLTSASSHELAEAVTDVDVGSATAFAPPLGWADEITGEEIGDFCENGSFNDVPVTAGGNTYTVQQLWSNMQNACVSAPAHFQVTMPATVIPGRPFNVTVTAQSSVNNSQLTFYSDKVHFTTSDGNSPILPADYTFVPSDSGTHTFQVTLNSLGTQTISVADTTVPEVVGNGSTDVEHNPDLIIASAHTDPFKQGDIGDTYTITVTNTGDKATDGTTVTATDSLPGGLTITNIAGSGWACVSSPPSCTRNDALAANASYPPITVTVNVSFQAASQLTNFVQVSGGGEFVTTNDTASDLTNVIQFPDLVVASFHVGVFAQGQQGETYALTVTNTGFVSTNGLVTLTDTLPTGLTATAISGTGWTCSTPPALKCTRSDFLLPFGNTYPPVTLTVNVSPTAPMPNVTNVAAVSGGGEVNTANDTANDVTTITSAASDLIVSSSHTGNFTQGQVGAVYNLTVTNTGSLATSASVKVMDFLPGIFTATAISGTGWTCDLPSVSCTRSDALAANGASYPPVTVTLNVSPTAPAQTSNNVQVSGGGELNLANDSASDTTGITQLPDLTITVSHFGQLAQGQTGQIYVITVNDVGSGATTGQPITVMDTLPSGLTATAISGTGWSCTLNNLTCTRSDSTFAFPPIMLTFNVNNNAPSSVTDSVNVSGGGEVNTANDSATDTESVLPPISFSPSNQSASVPAGLPAFFDFTLSSTPPGTGTLTCSAGVPAGAACSFVPATFVQGTNPITLTITTTAPGLGTALPSQQDKDRRPPWMILALLLGAAAAASLIRKSRPVRLRLAAGLAGMVLLLLLVSCGGGGPPKPPPVIPTPPGTYTITVTANNSGANVSNTLPVTLVVH